MRKSDKEALKAIISAVYAKAQANVGEGEAITQDTLFACIFDTLIQDFEPIAQSRASRYLRLALEEGILQCNEGNITLAK